MQHQLHSSMKKKHEASLQKEPKQTPPSSDQMTIIIARILQVGVMVSAAILLLGVILLPLRPGGLTQHRLQSFPTTLLQIWSGITTLHPQAFIALGIILLIATPVLRVAASIVAFGLERDFRYVVITIVVLLILVISFVLGIGGR